MARFDPAELPVGKLSWDPDNSGLGYRRRKDGKGGAWVIRFWVTMPDGSRERKPETLTACPNRIQALGVLRSRQGAEFQGTYTARVSGPTVRGFSTAFLDTKRDLKTVEKYKRQLTKHLLPALGERRLDDLTPADIEEYQRARVATGAMAATVRSEVRCLQSLITEARKALLTKNDPVRDATIVQVDNERGRTLTMEEQQRLLEQAKLMRRARYMHTFLLLLLNTGMRISHALRLRWDEIRDDEIHTQPDKKSRPVVIPMSAELVDELQLWRAICGSTTWLFTARNDNRRHATRNSVYEGFRRVLAQASIEALWPHDLRRTVITRLAASGASDKQIMAITGQRTASMVTRYEQPTTHQLREVVGRATHPRPAQGDKADENDRFDTEQDDTKTV